ncbi:hypothetical protein Q3G72_029332 [Acer saccharum]|nr:hypothetical protein Q3G72_029332 [Acer saccharum]
MVKDALKLQERRDEVYFRLHDSGTSTSLRQMAAIGLLPSTKDECLLRRSSSIGHLPVLVVFRRSSTAVFYSRLLKLILQ